MARRRLSRSVLAVLLTFAAVAFVTCIVIRFSFVSGRIRPVRVVSNSMASALLGPHFAWTCGDCSALIRCDAAQRPGGDRIVCPNCGDDGSAFSDASEVPGQRVLLDRFPYLWRSPARYEVVAFRSPTFDDRLEVKRIVGLPGETVSIRAGDLYIDGEVSRKTLQQLQAMAVLVHDAEHATQTSDAPPRWRPVLDGSGWSDSLRYQPQGELANRDYDWLAYHHWRCMSFSGRRTSESPVLDNYGLNQDVSRRLNRVTDLSLRCSLSHSRSGRFAILLNTGRNELLAEMDFTAGTLYLSIDGQPPRTCSTSAIRSTGFRVELAFVDRQALLAIDDEVLLSWVLPAEDGALPGKDGALPAKDGALPGKDGALPGKDGALPAEDGAAEPDSQSIRAGAVGGRFEIRRLQVWRDIYWLGPNASPGGWKQARLPEDEFIVLGDNVPVSRDSRSIGAIGRKSLIGKVFRH